MKSPVRSKPLSRVSHCAPDFLHGLGVHQTVRITRVLAQKGGPDYPVHHLGVARLWQVADKLDFLPAQALSHFCNHPCL